MTSSQSQKLSQSFKEARESFEKQYLISQLKKFSEIFLKLQNLLEWNGRITSKVKNNRVKDLN